MSIDSPCIGICRLDSTNQVCIGCFRTLEEIGRWSQMDEGQRLEVLAFVAQRSAAMIPEEQALRNEAGDR